MSVESFEMRMRTRIIGATIRDARLKANKGLEECGAFLEVPVERVEAFELGQELISMPELEILSYYLDIPIDQFIEKGSQPQENGKKAAIQASTLIRLRNRLIGANLRQSRLQAKMGLEQLASRSGIEASTIESYELGIIPVPFVVLELLCGLLNRSLKEFMDQQGIPGQWNKHQQALRDFNILPLELQVFISNPSNRPYLDLAMRLSNMSVEKLRAVAEGLLEITY